MGRRAAVIGLTAMVALAGCAGARSAAGVTDLESIPAATTLTTVTTTPDPAAPPVQQCDGVDPTAAPVVVTADADIASITLCRDGYTYVPGSGDWSSWETHVVPADRIPELVAALAQPSAAPDPNRICDAMLVIVPTVAVDFGDGTTGLAQAPSDGCHAQQRVRELLYDIVDTTPASVEPIAMITSDTALRAGCLGAKPLIPSSGSAAVVEVPDAALSACRYVTAAGQDTMLNATGPIDDDAVRTLLAGLSPTPAAGCGTSASELGNFVTVVVAPAETPADQRPSDSASGGLPLLSVATSGCPVVVDGAWTILGWTDPDEVAALVAATS